MSVDTKLIIGRLDKAFVLSDEGIQWLSVVATIDLRALGIESLIHQFGERPELYKSAFFYSDDDTKIVEDKYGTKLFAIPMAEFVKVFKQECKRNENAEGTLYRRLAWALPLLTRMKNYQPLDNLHVILFYH